MRWQEEVIPAMQVKAPKAAKSGGLFSVAEDVQGFASEIMGESPTSPPQ